MVRYFSIFTAAALLCCAAPAACAAAESEELVLHVFSGHDGAGPAGALIEDPSGKLYGVTRQGGRFNQGAVFVLSPPATGQGKWSETVIHSFPAGATDGTLPSGTLVRDAAGNLYGVTNSGGPFLFGTVFRLSPPAAGRSRWTETLLHGFGRTNQDGADPAGGLSMDAAGNLYGLTFEGGSANRGTVFELARPRTPETAWSESQLYSFQGKDGAAPVGVLSMDGQGGLYGVTSAGGTFGDGSVFELALKQGQWVHSQLFAFSQAAGTGASPQGGVAFSPSGTLVGTTDSGGPFGTGTVFELSPPAAGQKQWTQLLLTAFQDSAMNGAFPQSGVAISSTGEVFGTAQGGGKFGDGTLFMLEPPAGMGEPWNQTVLRDFGRRRAHNSPGPYASLLLDGAGNLYGSTYAGGRGYGTVYRMTP